MATWLNGERADGPTTAFDLSDRGLLLGDGVFDTALVLEGQVVYREAHLARLHDNCQAIGLPLHREALAVAMDTAAAGVVLGSVRVTVTRGPGGRGLVPQAPSHPTIIASHAKFASSSAFRTVSLWPSPIRRNETSPSSRLKTLGYLDAILATRDARDRGFDEALFLNTRGRVVCAGTANLFVLGGPSLVTPPLDEGLLPGVTRTVVMRLAAELGLVVLEQPIDPTDLARADAVFVTNSLKMIAPVKIVGDQSVSVRAGELVARLMTALCADVSRVCRIDAERHLRTTSDWG